MPLSAVTPVKASFKVDGARLSPEGKEESCVTLPASCELVIEFEQKNRTPPRLVLLHKKIIQLVWPLAELSKIEIRVDAGDDAPPYIKFWVQSDLPGQRKPPAESVILKAFDNGAMMHGPKLLFLTATAARELLEALIKPGAFEEGNAAP